MTTLLWIAVAVIGLSAARNTNQAKKVVIDLRDLVKWSDK